MISSENTGGCIATLSMTRASEKARLGVVRLLLFLVVAVGMVGAPWPDAIGGRAVGDESQGRYEYEAAIRYFTRIIELGEVSEENLGNAFYNRGNAFYSTGAYEQAILDYSRALRLNPDNADAYYNRGNSYANLGRDDRAIRDYSQTIGFKPDHDFAYYNRGNSYFRKGDYRRAIEDYEKAYLLSPNDDVYQRKIEELGLSR